MVAKNSTLAKQHPPKPKVPLIYEAHVGMSSQKEKVASEFTIIFSKRTLVINSFSLSGNPAEHPYYGSFGYHVSNFLRCFTRFGTPGTKKFGQTLRTEWGLRVIIDLVPHSRQKRNRSLAIFTAIRHNISSQQITQNGTMIIRLRQARSFAFSGKQLSLVAGRIH